MGNVQTPQIHTRTRKSQLHTHAQAKKTDSMPSDKKKDTKTFIGGKAENLGRTFLGLQKVDEEVIHSMVNRLTKDGHEKAPDANRTGANKEMGIFNSFAAKGW